jgi:predicted RNA-binding protein with PUA-like domain
MPSYWLLKTEPDDYSFEQLVSDRRTIWDGVANNLAQQHMRAMQKGDRVLIYHTGKERSVVGIAEVTRKPFPDPTSENPKHVAVEIKSIRKLPYPVKLADIKNNRTFDDFELVTITRLSAMPVKPLYWKTITGMGGL